VDDQLVDPGANSRDYFGKLLIDSLVVPDALQVNSLLQAMSDPSHRVRHDVGFVAAEFQSVDDSVNCFEQDGFGHKLLEVRDIRNKAFPATKPQGELAEVLLCPLADDVGQLVPRVLVLGKIGFREPLRRWI